MTRTLAGFIIAAGSLLPAGFAAAGTAAPDRERLVSVAGGALVDRADARVLLDGVRGYRMILSQGIRVVSEIDPDGADLSRTTTISARRSARPRVRVCPEIEPR